MSTCHLLTLRSFSLLTLFLFTSCGGESTANSSSAADSSDSADAQQIAETPEHAEETAAKVAPAPNIEALPIADADLGDWRAVWVQSAEGKGDGDVFLREEHLKLMARERGGEERVVVEAVSNYRRPLITPDGEGIVYSNFIEQKHYFVPFSGGEPRFLGEGFALEVWEDPMDGRSYVFAGTAAPGADAQIEINEVSRYPLDDPSSQEVFWDGGRVSLDNFQLSRSGEVFGGLFPWPAAGVGQVGEQSWEKYASGCWASLAPDDSRLLWIFDGPHQNVTLADRGLDGEPTRRWVVPMNNTPALAGHEVYHPRWSNHPSFFAESGPYTDTGQKDLPSIFGGGANVEIYVGQFSPDLSVVGHWYQLTENSVGDFCPDFWVRGGDEVSLDLAAVREGKPNGKIAAEYAADGWPGETGGLAFLWDSNRSRNEMALADGTKVACAIEPAGLATYGSNHGIQLGAGMGMADADSAARIVRALAGSGSFTLELMAFTDNFEQKGNPRLLTLGSEKAGELLVLEQKGGLLGAAVRSSESAEMSPQFGNKETWFDWNNSLPLAIRFSAGRVEFFRDGKTWNGFQLPGDLSNWADAAAGAYLVFGNNLKGDQPWRGNLEKIAVYDRALPTTLMEIKHTALIADLSARKRPPLLKMNARLLSESPIPEPDSLGAYRRALSVYTYEVLDVHDDAAYEHKTIRVAHWTVLDRQKLRTFPRGIGVDYYLMVEPFDGHPQLKSERISDTDDASLQPLYFDISTPVMEWPQNP